MDNACDEKKQSLELNLLSRLFDCMIYLYRNREESVFPDDADAQLSCVFLRDRSMEQAWAGKSRDVPFLFDDLHFPDIYYGAVLHGSEVIAAGPFARKKLPVNILTRYVREHHLGDRDNYFIRTVPASKAAGLMSLIALDIFGIDAETAYVTDRPGKKDAGETQPDRRLFAYEVQRNNEEEDKPHFPYKFEKQLFDHIQNGDDAGMDSVLFIPEKFTSGKLAFSELKDEEYKLVGLITLFCRAAISGGVPPYEAYDIGQVYLQKTAKCKSKEEYYQIREECFRHYCRSVRDARLNETDSIYVRRCKGYILQHINRKFSFDDLAKYAGASKSYVSKLFHDTEGKTITEFILGERIKAAQNMLKFSEYPITQISNYLCFCDHSYFCRVFKSMVGTEPSEYRRLNKCDGF